MQSYLSDVTFSHSKDGPVALLLWLFKQATHTRPVNHQHLIAFIAKKGKVWIFSLQKLRKQKHH